MAAEDVSGLGERLRARRIERRLSLRALAREVGVSASMVSQIETGKSRPSVSTLYAMTTALGLSLEDLFARAAAEVPAPAEAVAAGDYAWPASLPAHRLGPHVRPEDRTCLTLDTGVTWERLGQLPPHNTDFLLVTYPPGASSSSSAGLMRHSGSEYGYVLAGELTLTLGFEEIRLAPGDAVSFESATPHRYRNDGPEPATGVWFVAG
jgi:transcriptional regulator with XRE-family HTH domain